MFKRIIIFLILLQISGSGIIYTQPKKEKNALKQTLSFKLKEPKLKKKNATDWMKTMGLAAGSITVGGGLYILTSPKKPEPEKKLPKPPEWP